MDQSFEPRRFRTTVPFYSRYRVPYPDELLAQVGARVGLKPNEGVLDLGCGPGLLAIPYAKMGARVTAIDPEPDMIAATEEAAAEAGVSLEIWQASSFSLPDGIGPFRLVAMGRAFHWTDREKTARILDHLVMPGGALASFGDTVLRSAETAWREEWLRIMDEFGGSMKEMRLVNGVYRGDEAMLFESPFSKLSRISTIIRREIDVDEVLGRSFSMSRTSKERLGARLGDFETAMRKMLDAHMKALKITNGHVVEISEIYALIAERP